MPNFEEANLAMTNRSLRNIRTELEYLTDSSVISPQQLSSILSQLPNQIPLHAPLIPTSTNGTPIAVAAQQPPVNQFANTSLNEKQNGYYPHAAIPGPPPPPAYGAPAPSPPALATASALYPYNPTDAGDLALLPNDRIFVTEYANAEWWKGRNERTGQEGIFPRSYVNVMQDKGSMAPVPAPGAYGNMPLEVSQSGSTPTNQEHHPNKIEEGGKKFGKKLGNAAIFGAGASIGSNIVNGIF
ncbi:MAG: hypothetical protein M1827_003722 [Pycnora praestabilis]|nr:MAG: hypothetical protein M1827_003722 [Pycnora praestabilis]